MMHGSSGNPDRAPDTPHRRTVTMFSLQTIFGKGDKFFDLLHESAKQCSASAQALQAIVNGEQPAALEEFDALHQHEKALASEISEGLIDHFVTALDREDIEALNAALYRIPKTIQKFAERYQFVSERLGKIDFQQRAELLVRATQVVEEMVAELKKGMRIGRVKPLQERLQAIESEADRLLLEPYNALYVESSDPLRVMLAKDLYELLEKAIDKCRDAGNVVYTIVLKNS